ncbi:hypothetical protein HY949_01525 [Candidatus Gottesmanbacteria bacterium]|nr:hypothetical protein [Candidatus Gottesmanbacteria bacterium]
MTLISFIFLLFNLSFALLIFFLTIAFVTGAPFVRSNKKAVDAMIRLAKIKKGSVVYDMGSGDGTLLFRAAALDATAVRIEINPFLVLWTNLKILLTPYKQSISVRWQNFWKTDFHDAEVVFVYLLPWRMESLEALLKQKCKPGTRIVSNSFIFPTLLRTGEDAAAHIYAFTL